MGGVLASNENGDDKGWWGNVEIGACVMSFWPITSEGYKGILP